QNAARLLVCLRVVQANSRRSGGLAGDGDLRGESDARFLHPRHLPRLSAISDWETCTGTSSLNQSTQPNNSSFTCPVLSGTMRVKLSCTCMAGLTPRACSKLAERSCGVMGLSAGYAAKRSERPMIRPPG